MADEYMDSIMAQLPRLDAVKLGMLSFQDHHCRGKERKERSYGECGCEVREQK